jgi:hypothetical protein
MTDIWDRYNIEFRFLGLLCASVPGNPNIMGGWLDSRKPNVKPPGGRSIEEIQTEIMETLAQPQETAEEEQARMLNVFQRVKNGKSSGSYQPLHHKDDEGTEISQLYTPSDGFLAVRSGTLKAHIKDCGRIVSSQRVGKIEGEAAYSTRVINCVYLNPAQYWIPILDADGNNLTQPSGTKEKPISFTTRRGKMSALKVFEVIEEPIIRFQLLVLRTMKTARKTVSLEDLETLFSYGSVHGYGGERGDGEGRYTFTIEEATSME